MCVFFRARKVPLSPDFSADPADESYGPIISTGARRRNKRGSGDREQPKSRPRWQTPAGERLIRGPAAEANDRQKGHKHARVRKSRRRSTAVHPDNTGYKLIKLTAQPLAARGFFFIYLFIYFTSLAEFEKNGFSLTPTSSIICRPLRFPCVGG